MKKAITLIFLIFLFISQIQAQFFDHLKNKINQKVNDAVDKTVDNATNGKRKKTDSTQTSTIPTANKTNNPVASSTGSVGSAGSVGSSDQSDIKAYSKFDFVPGEKIIVEEDFSQDAVGEFPSKWNTKTSAEVVTVNNQPGKWLAMSKNGIFYPDYMPVLPDNFTFQADVMANNTISEIGSLVITLANTKNDSEKFLAGEGTSDLSYPGIKLALNPQHEGYKGEVSYTTTSLGTSTINNTTDLFHAPTHNFAKLSIWRQKQRVRIYLNSTKIFDIPRALEPNTIINSLILKSYEPNYSNKGGSFFISNIRIAVGAADTRNKLITLGKFVSHGILFDVNSDQIKPESFGALQDISNVLKDNPAVHVKIIGHTDSDGDDKTNLDLSKRRAAAVKAMLVSNFQIDASRLITDGKGKSQPITSNATLAGKANNRRVEFIKL